MEVASIGPVINDSGPFQAADLLVEKCVLRCVGMQTSKAHNT